MKKYYIILFLFVYIFNIYKTPLTAQSCNNEDPGSEVGNTGCVNLVYLGENKTYTTVRAADGNIWLKQNLGSNNPGVSTEDESSFGDFFQWGRFDDGHQLRNSEKTSIYPIPNNPIGLGNGNPRYFEGGGHPYNNDYTGWWKNWNENDKWEAASISEVSENNALDPCKALGRDWYIPTENDWINIIAAERMTNVTSALESNLKLVPGGVRKDNGISFAKERGYYWSRSISSNSGYQKFLYYSNRIFNPHAGDARKQAASVRCLKYSISLGTEEINTNPILIIYPNPTSGMLYIKTDKEIKEVQIFNTQGQSVLRGSSKKVDLNEITPGIYLIKVTLNNNQILTQKIIKK